MNNFHVLHKEKNVIPAKAGIYNRINKAQSTVEFTFAMIIIMFLIYGMVRVFRWVGMDLANRRVAQDTSLTTLIGTDPNSELNPDFSSVQPMAAVYHGKITNGNNIRP